MFSGLCPPFFDGYACVKSRIGSKLFKIEQPRVYTNKFLGTVPRLPVLRPPGGSLGTGKIAGTGAALFLGALCL